MKNKLRSEIKKKREALHKEFVHRKSNEISDLFLNSRYYKESKYIMSYLSIKNEVSTEYINNKIISDGKVLIIPYINEADEVEPTVIDTLENLTIGKYGILEPKILDKKLELSSIDLVIVPAVVYDKRGNRIGFGKGYYDKFLSKLTKEENVFRGDSCFINNKCEVGKPYFIGLAYDFQIVEEIGNEPHDVAMDYIFTNINQ